MWSNYPSRLATTELCNKMLSSLHAVTVLSQFVPGNLTTRPLCDKDYLASQKAWVFLSDVQEDQQLWAAPSFITRHPQVVLSNSIIKRSHPISCKCQTFPIAGSRGVRTIATPTLPREAARITERGTVAFSSDSGFSLYCVWEYVVA